MQLDITFKNIDSSDALRDYATKRLSKIDKYIERPSDLHVVLSVEKRRHKADIALNADGVMINAVEITEDMYAAIDMVVDKLERQVKKHKEKVQGKKGQTKVYFEGGEAAAGETVKPRIIHEKDYFVKPMSVEEAVLQIGMAPNDFIIFQNTDSNQINLIYKRQDGDLGLVEPLI
ncbi:MAG TPA: ribosome-associated translation inhibitor RaiA [Deltaproteobacteria bacterium]|nr:ribosome-associated translation inhibitor RaiA [Deltaproteobacteria bacterium]HPJ95442.1 ribosome-associated translation inhibitor RaiA [Deltaproteobacteria bacterium]HPR50934.1 ribosome-associated translation inhibitor RaiA [Deltaproteobacteria bacterium]